MTSRCIQVFAKAPVPGKVKTRLQPALSGEDCARLSRAMIRHSLRTARALPGVEVQLWCFPGDRDPFFREIAAEYAVTLHVQTGANLGDRMKHALREGLATRDAVILIGSDCPFYSQDYLQHGFDLLERDAQVVIGPATDGGYLLIGANRAIPDDAFDGIAWGAPDVFRDTLDRLEAHGITPRLLPIMSDIDRPEDLRKFR